MSVKSGGFRNETGTQLLQASHIQAETWTAAVRPLEGDIPPLMSTLVPEDGR